MHDVFVDGENAITSLGFSVSEHIDKIKNATTGVLLYDDRILFPEPFYASLVDTVLLEKHFAVIGNPENYTKFEQLMILSAHYALSEKQVDAASDKTIFIISSTKGNVELLAKAQRNRFDADRDYLWKAAEIIARFFGNKNTAVVISNACISGVLAINYAYDLLSTGAYENAIVIGGDVASEFIVSGFQSFKSLSFGLCKPFDVNRDGLNLGEGAGTLVLTTNPSSHELEKRISVLGGASSNDANHISGPSRTGDGLYYAVTKAMQQAGVEANQIDFISAHGTATPFNDEMESKAFASAGLSDVPLNSLKGYFGHTMGGAGTIEAVISLQGMKQNLLFGTLGYKEYGVPEKITIVDKLTEKVQNYILKTASGFGGCNAAVIFAK
ncbi:MAG: beta-ketoacyl synthase N-terminal-like domain-containing protein [Bacteroidota bacterium]